MINKPFVLISLDKERSRPRLARTELKHIRDVLGGNPHKIKVSDYGSAATCFMCSFSLIEFDYRTAKALELAKRFKQRSIIAVDNYRFARELFCNDDEPKFLGKWIPCNEATAKLHSAHYLQPNNNQYFIFKEI